ncbi:MAG: hypothetical protein ACRDWD_07210 [Acidimicrobiia bacterium]
MKFVQFIELKSSKIDQVQALDAEWEKATEGKRTVSRATILADRDVPNTYILAVEFPSYEDAMKNNELPETQRFAAEQAKLADGPATFRNLDVIDDRTL